MDTFHSKTNTFSRNLSAYFDDRMSSFGVATSYVELLLILRENKGATQKKLAEKLSLAPSTITRFIDKLRGMDLVKKDRDGRQVIVRLTDKGEKMSSEMEVAYQSAVSELREIVGEKFVDTVGKLLEFGNDTIEKKLEE